jgi:hypothetical protein
MKTYPARFVGEFDLSGAWDGVPNVGDVAVTRDYPDGILRAYIRCACGDIDVIRIEGPNGPNVWSLTSRDPVHLDPSVRVRLGDISMCHYFVHNGELQMLDDTTAQLK